MFFFEEFTILVLIIFSDMLKVENISVSSLESAIRGMRNPMNSHSKSDSRWSVGEKTDGVQYSYFRIGPDDLDLCKRLIKAGPSDRKFLRMIHVQMDIVSSLYWWKEMDQYKVSTTTNSCSTMHRIHSRDLVLSDFSYDHLDDRGVEILRSVIDEINRNRALFMNTGDKKYWWNMIQLLPSSYNQRRTWDGDYETLLGMYFARRNHQLDEWHSLCDAIMELPYMREFASAMKS